MKTPDFIINVSILPNASGAYPWEVRTPSKSLAYGEESTYFDAMACAESAWESARLAKYWDAVANALAQTGGAS